MRGCERQCLSVTIRRFSGQWSVNDYLLTTGH
jgi:hypothetical protein